MSKPIVTALLMSLIVASQVTSAFAGGKSTSARTGNATGDHGVAPTHGVADRTDATPAHKIATVAKTTDMTLKRGTLPSYGFHMTTYHASFPPR